MAAKRNAVAARDWSSTPNDLRTRKNHLVTLTDEAWEALAAIAGKGSKSKVLESLILSAARRLKKPTRSA